MGEKNHLNIYFFAFLILSETILHHFLIKGLSKYNFIYRRSQLTDLISYFVEIFTTKHNMSMSGSTEYQLKLLQQRFGKSSKGDNYSSSNDLVSVLKSDTIDSEDEPIEVFKPIEIAKNELDREDVSENAYKLTKFYLGNTVDGYRFDIDSINMQGGTKCYFVDVFQDKLDENLTIDQFLEECLKKKWSVYVGFCCNTEDTRNRDSRRYSYARDFHNTLVDIEKTIELNKNKRESYRFCSYELENTDFRGYHYESLYRKDMILFLHAIPKYGDNMVDLSVDSKKLYRSRSRNKKHSEQQIWVSQYSPILFNKETKKVEIELLTYEETLELCKYGQSREEFLRAELIENSESKLKELIRLFPTYVESEFFHKTIDEDYDEEEEDSYEYYEQEDKTFKESVSSEYINYPLSKDHYSDAENDIALQVFSTEHDRSYKYIHNRKFSKYIETSSSNSFIIIRDVAGFDTIINTDEYKNYVTMRNPDRSYPKINAKQLLKNVPRMRKIEYLTFMFNSDKNHQNRPRREKNIIDERPDVEDDLDKAAKIGEKFFGVDVNLENYKYTKAQLKFIMKKYASEILSDEDRDKKHV